jgi:hypothetical protein
MNRVVGVVRNHARRYRDLLKECWEQTDWTQAQAQQVLRRMDQVLEQLPKARKQALVEWSGGATGFAACSINSRHSGLKNFTGPARMPQSTLKICAPPMPTRFMASRSAVMPSRVTFPFIQCHQVCGLAESGGSRKPVSSESTVARAAVATVVATSAAASKRESGLLGPAGER